MIRILLIGLAVLLCSAAHAQKYDPTTGQQIVQVAPPTTNPASGNPIGAVVVPAYVGNGALSLTTSSVALNTMTVNSTGGALPSTFGSMVYLKNDGGQDFAFCAKGGTCTCAENTVAVTNGVIIKPTFAYGFNLAGVASSAPTIVSCSGTTLAGIQF